MANQSLSTVAAGVVDLIAYAGDTFAVSMIFSQDDAGLVPMDLRPLTLKMQIKKQKTGDPLMTLLVGDGLTIAGVAFNELDISKIMPILGGNYFYDIQATFTDGSITTLLMGKFTIVQDVTDSTTES